MKDKIFLQLFELARAFNKRGFKPVICGGLGVYLSFYLREKELSLRTTNDIDLMLTKSQVCEESLRNTIADIITEELGYLVCEDGKHFQFQKGDQQYLDILTERVRGIVVEGFRAKLVKSRLHGYVTDEACFIEEDLKTIRLSDILPECKEAADLEISVPSLTNQLILKLFAFQDRYKGQRKEVSLAQVHAFDIFVIVTFAGVNDYREGQKLLNSYRESPVIRKAGRIIEECFSSLDGVGWQYVLGTANFYPDLDIRQKREKLDEAKRRLVKWFSVDVGY